MNLTVGFIGGGRVVRIILSAWHREKMVLNKVLVSDCSAPVLKQLKQRFSEIDVTDDNI